MKTDNTSSKNKFNQQGEIPAQHYPIMKRYDLSKIMKAVHQIKKYMKLYSLTHGIKTWANCLKLAWANEKKMVADEEARNAEKEAMKAALAQPAKRSAYDSFHAPASAYYTSNSRGRFGSCFVGD